MSLHIRRLRTARKLTQAQLAKRCGVTANAISRYERGLDDPRLVVLDRLLVALECRYEDLRGSPEKPIPRRRRRRARFVDWT